MFVLALLLTSSPLPLPQPSSSSLVLDPRVIPKAGEHVLVGAGDIADCRGTAADETARIVEAVLAHSANALAFTAGDNAYSNGTLEEFQRCYAPTWGRFLERTAPVAGNHEYNSKGAAGHFAYFGKRAGSKDKPWRALTKGAWKVLLLDSNCDEVGGCAPGSPQARWLATELSRTPQAKCTVAIWHHPRFSSGPHGNDARSAGLWQQLVDAKAELVVTGHDHHYERLAGLEGGMASFVVGTGGRQPYPVVGNAPGSAVRIGGVPGVIVLFLDDDGWRAFFVDTTGKVRDEARGKCG
jgi:acid phosphatase type 7